MALKIHTTLSVLFGEVASNCWVWIMPGDNEMIKLLIFGFTVIFQQNYSALTNFGGNMISLDPKSYMSRGR